MNTKILVFFLLLVSSFSRRHLNRQNVEFVEPSEVKTVLESNHFFSETQRETTEKIGNLIKNQALIFMLKDTDGNKDASLAENPIQIQLSSSGEKAYCAFNTVHNMCSLKKVEEELQLKIQCKNTPCELSWVVVQPKAIENDGMHSLDELVQINKDYNHAMLMATCPDPNVQNFQDKIKLFTNSKYEKISNQGVVYYLFDNEQKGYYFLTTEDEGTKACVNMSIKHNPDEIKFNDKDQVMMDYISPGKTNAYEIPQVPETDFRVDAYYHHAKHVQLNAKSSVEVSLIGEKGSDRTKLQTMTIPGRESGSIDFSIVFKKPSSEYQHLVLDVTNKGEDVIIIDMDFKSDERQEVNLGETSYFHLRAGESINYKLLAESADASDSQKTHIFSSNPAKFVASSTVCKTKVGCEFTLEAKEEGEGNLYFGEGEKENVNEQIIIDIDKSITKKLREGEIVMLKKAMKAKKTFQAVVNSPNVLIYASTKQKCPELSPECHQKVMNSHNPFIYEPSHDQDLYFLVHSFDNCEFTLTIIDEGTEYVELQDTKPFTYLFDDGEKEMKFEFKLKEKEDVNFNLIGPVNELNLVVMNDERWTDDNRGEGQASTEGYLSFKKEDMTSLNFVIKVEKKEEFLKKYIHFTLLVSTKEGNVRLQPGISHFQTIKSEQTRDFVFQFEPKKQILLNIYTHNVLTQLQLDMKVSTTDEYDKEDQVMSFSIDSSEDVLDLKDVSEQLCKDEMAENCQLFVRFENKMGIQLDVTLTLMIRDAIIQLKDGIWNSFKETEVAKTSHFYFLPKHPNKSVTILYRADYLDLKIMYTIWKTDDKSINPSQWPFPTSIKSTPEDATSPFLAVRPTKLIHVDSQALKQCWMNCVILVTVFQDKSGPKSRYGIFNINRTFKIMGSNNFVEIPQKHKVDIILKSEEEKHLLVDLKYVIQKNALTFFTYFTMGSVSLTGNVYDEENPRCPTQDEPSDFIFGRVETQISVATIKRKLEQNQMSEEKHPYVCILARALTDTKFSIEYDSSDEIMNQLTLDSSYVHKALAKTVKIFQVDATQEFKLKITRSAGFPFIDQALCKSNEDLESCLNTFKEKTSKGEQMATLMTAIEQQPCEKCIFFLKITSDENTEINIHSQSKYVETQLQEKRVLADEVEKDEVNKYIITSSRNLELNINIQITHGDINVTVNDFAGTFIAKSNQKGTNHILISIPPPPNDPNSTATVPAWGRVFFSAFAQSTLKTYHLEIKPSDGKSKAAYSVTYSSGSQETYLQDGLITTQALLPNRTTKFLYINPTLGKIYLHLSASTGQVLQKFHVRILSMPNQKDEQSGVQITPQKANFNKKTPNPTRIMSLPGNKFYQILIESQNKEVQLVTLGINNQEIIYLPFNHQFPVQLNKGDFIYLVINSPFQAFMDIEVKKCGESVLTIAHTADYQEFLKEEFENQQEMDHDQLTASLQIKTKMRGAVYLKLKSSPDEVSVVTVKATFSFSKSKMEKTAAGGKGLLSYQLLNSKTAEIQFEPLVCPSINKNCQKQFTYASISAQKPEGVYAQLVCPSMAFELEDRQILSEGKAKNISAANKHNSSIYFEQTFSSDLDYVGVKATNTRTGEVVYYKPIQIATFWGQVQKNGKGSGSMVGMVALVLVICCILLVYRRKKKRREGEEYLPLSGAD